MPGRFELRAVELHGHRIWQRSAVARTLDFMRDHDLDTLVLHESDIVHQLVYPRAYFDPHALWTDVPSRRGENAIFNNRAYMTDLLRLARKAGVAVYLNVKEIGFSDEVLSIRPDLFKNGAVCPSEPFWTDYITHKVDDLFTDFPDLAGLIASFGSQESRASRVQNRCRCDLCRAENLETWYSRMIFCLHEPVSRHGKRLAVRDFAYKPSDHAPLVAAMRRAPQDVVFCIKAMPHDFYLTFPDNPALGALRREQWVEYDVLGQFFGWGIMPCSVHEDLRARMPRWQEAGATGVIFRIEWERLNDLYCFDNISETNLIAAALLASGQDIAAAEVCRRWLAARGLNEGAAPWLADLVSESTEIVLRTAYMAGFVMADNSMLPRSIERAWWGAEVRDALIPWDPSRAGALDLDHSRIGQYLAEKTEALSRARALRAAIDAAGSRVDHPTHRAVASLFAPLIPWVEGHRLAAAVCLYARGISGPNAAPDPGMVRILEGFIKELEAYAERVAVTIESDGHAHHVAMLMDPRRALDVAAEGRIVLNHHRAT